MRRRPRPYLRLRRLLKPIAIAAGNWVRRWPQAWPPGSSDPAPIRLRQHQRCFRKLFRRREVIVAIEMQFVGHRRTAIKLLILLVAATELAADQIPRQLQQRHTPLRGVAGRRDVALELT